MQSSLRKWGNSVAVRIPANVMAAADLRLDQKVEVREENGCIVIDPRLAPDFSLDALLDGITEDNLHSETNEGGPLGAEAW